jgi:signal transduction histidine kinase
LKLRLRWRILLFTVLPIVLLAFVTLGVVNRSISRQMHENIQSDLERAAAVLENVIAARDRELAVAAQVIVEDPKFFSVLTLPGSHRDAQLRSTVAGVARDFNRITDADLFEVMDHDGNRLASVGPQTTSPTSRARFVASALTGRQVSGILVEDDGHYHVSVTPALAGDRVVGTLLIGSRIGQPLAVQLRDLTRSQVTFLSSGEVTGSTLTDPRDHQALVEMLSRDGGRLPLGDRPGVVSELKGGEHTYLTLARRLPTSDPAASQVYVMQRALDTETAFLRAMQSDLVQLGLAAVLAALLAGYFVAERITSPLSRLVRCAEEMERGNYDYPLDVTDRSEIGYLARRFGDMRRHQRAYVQSLRQVARMKSEFLSVASHELRTPISVIAGFQELMVGEKLGPISDGQRHGLDAIKRSVNTLGRIAEDATRMAQIEGEGLRLSIGDCDLRAIVEDAIQDARRDARGRRVDVSNDVPADIGFVRADGRRLTQALTNLLRNGICFTPDGGRVSVDAQRAGVWMEVRVHDTGVGIPVERLAGLFDAIDIGHDTLNHHSSSSLEFNSAGLGFGLSIAKGIVEAHQGSIEVTSSPGQGSTFVIRIPSGASDNATRELQEAA